jgi:hypothetical protein
MFRFWLNACCGSGLLRILSDLIYNDFDEQLDELIAPAVQWMSLWKSWMACEYNLRAV